MTYAFCSVNHRLLMINQSDFLICESRLRPHDKHQTKCMQIILEICEHIYNDISHAKIYMVCFYIIISCIFHYILRTHHWRWGYDNHSDMEGMLLTGGKHGCYKTTTNRKSMCMVCQIYEKDNIEIYEILKWVLVTFADLLSMYTCLWYQAKNQKPCY